MPPEKEITVPKGIYKRNKAIERELRKEEEARLTPIEKNLIAEMEKTLADPASNVREKYNAQVTVRQVREEAKSRYLRAKALEEIGPCPSREYFPTGVGYKEALHAYHDGIERIAAQDVLGDAASSLKQIAAARQTLEEIEARERRRGGRGDIRHKEYQETPEERAAKEAAFAAMGIELEQPEPKPPDEGTCLPNDAAKR